MKRSTGCLVLAIGLPVELIISPYGMHCDCDGNSCGMHCTCPGISWDVCIILPLGSYGTFYWIPRGTHCIHMGLHVRFNGKWKIPKWEAKIPEKAHGMHSASRGGQSYADASELPLSPRVREMIEAM